MMGKPHPVGVRQRVVDHVAEGNTHRATAARFRVSVRFGNGMVKLRHGQAEGRDRGSCSNAAGHRGTVWQTLRDIGCRFLPLPPYSPDLACPDLNLLEMAVAKLKARLRKATARTCEDLWKTVGPACNLLRQDECLTHRSAKGYEPQWE